DHRFKYSRLNFVPLRGVRNVAHDHVETAAGRTEVRDGLRGKRLGPVFVRHAGPVFLGLSHVFLRFAFDDVANLIRELVRVPGSRQGHLQFIPQPLPGRRKIEIMTFDSEAVYKRNSSPGRLSGSARFTQLEQNCSHEADFDYFATHAADFYPVPDTNPVA